jgi:arginase
MIQLSLLGIPNDDNSSFMKGPAEAPALIRRELHCDAYSMWSETGIDLSAAGRLVDHGDIQFDGAGDPWDLIERDVGRALESGDPLICLGGDHAVTHPIMRAVRRRHPHLTILHIDAHPDIYHAYQGNPRSHTSPFARIMEERLADRLIQVGLRTVNDHHRDQFKRFGVEVIEAARWSQNLRFDITAPVYVSIDMDSLDPAAVTAFSLTVSPRAGSRSRPWPCPTASCSAAKHGGDGARRPGSTAPRPGRGMRINKAVGARTSARTAGRQTWRRR